MNGADVGRHGEERGARADGGEEQAAQVEARPVERVLHPGQVLRDAGQRLCALT